MDDKGIEINKEDAQIIRLDWDNVAFARIFKESTSFFAKDASGIVISVTNKYKDQIMQIAKNGKNPDKAKSATLVFASGCGFEWWTINGTAAAAPSVLRLMIAGRLRIGLSVALASSATRQSRGQVSNGLEQHIYIFEKPL